MYTSRIAEEIGGYDETLFLAEDFEYWVRIYENAQIDHLDRVLYTCRRHEKSLTSTREKEIRSAAVKVYLKHMDYITSGILKKKELYHVFDRIMQLTDQDNRRDILDKLTSYEKKYLWRYITRTMSFS